MRYNDEQREEDEDSGLDSFEEADIRWPEGSLDEIDSSIDVLAVGLGYPPDGEDAIGTLRKGYTGQDHWDTTDEVEWNRRFNTYLYADPIDLTARLEAIING